MQQAVSDLHAAARKFAQNGIPVFPCVPDTKTPATEHGFHDATTDLVQIDAWWTAEPRLNIAFCPHMAGLAIIDLDGEPGEASWDAWQIEHGFLPLTYTVRTPRGGRHLYYRGILPPTQSKLGLHVDTRGVGSYALIPPSTFQGKPYVLDDSRAPADLGDEVGAYLEKLKKEHVRAAVSDLDLPQNVSRARKLLTDYVERGHVAIEDQMGDQRTFAVACEIQNLGLSPEMALELMLALWNPHCRPPWDEDELEVKVENASRYAQNEAGAWAVGETKDVFASALDKLSPEDLQPSPPEEDKPEENPFRLWTLRELRNRPPPTWLIPGLFPADGTSVMYGLPGTFKSFLAVHYCCQLAALGVPVVYVAGEDSSGIRQRIDGWCMANDLMDADLPLWVVENSPRAKMPETCKMFADAAREVGPALIVIDTLAWAAVGLNENDSRDMMTLLDEMGKIRKGLGCAMLIIHHSGKDGDRGPRGSGALTAGCDAAFEVVRPSLASAAVAMYCRRQKNSELPPKPWTFEARKLGSLAVMQPMSLADFHAVTSTLPKIKPVHVGAALRELGAVGEAAAVSTDVLAHKMAELNTTTPEEAEGMKSGFAIMLGRGSVEGGSLQAYCIGEPPKQRWFATE